MTLPALILVFIAVPAVIGYAAFWLAAIPLGTRGRVALLFAVAPIAVVVWKTLVALHAFGADDACCEECWGNLGVAVIMISAGVGGVLACAIALGRLALSRRPRGSLTAAAGVVSNSASAPISKAYDLEAPSGFEPLYEALQASA